MDKLEVYFQNTADELPLDGGQLRREVAYERIKDAIKFADLHPGDSLSEVKLSNLLGISRTPIREALHQLAQEGFVEVTPGRGVTIARRTLKEIMDAVHMRLVLEPELARLAARSATNQQIEALLDALTNMELASDKGDYPDWKRADEEYHRILGDACPNPLMGKTVTEMRNRIRHLAHTVFQMTPKRIGECTVEHRQVALAVAERDEAAAEKYMHYHIEKLRESIFDKMTYG